MRNLVRAGNSFARFCVSTALLAVVLATGARQAWAATDIVGTVRNAQGAAVAGAKVSVEDSKGAAKWTGTTGKDGGYHATALAPGSYTVVVTGAQGGNALRRQVVLGQGGEPVKADFQFVAAAAAASIAAEERNPNIFVYKIDLNDLRNRLTVGRGPDPTYTPQFTSDQNYFGAEFGSPLFPYEVLRPRNLLRQWRGSLYALHQNSPLNARNFFNVGRLLPSRSTSYSMAANGPLASDRANLLLQYGDTLTSGYVNGNVQSPGLAPGDRTPRTGDPRKDAYIASLLNAYPLEQPNLGATRLNSNATRNINAQDALARVDFKWTANDSVALRYTISDYSEDPFQIVAGQNPQTDVRTQGGYASLTHVFSPTTTSRFAFNFDRTAAKLLPTQKFLNLFKGIGVSNVPDVDFQSDEFTDLGPLPQFPRVRAQNRFQGFGEFTHVAGSHTMKAGWSTTRVQLNDLQSDTQRGLFRFLRDFGRSETENFLAGTPSTYIIAIGNFYRGFRDWEHFGYFEDSIKLRPNLTINAGVRYEVTTAPTEVNNLTDTGYKTDANNFAPRFGFAYAPGKNSKTVLRGAYGISFGQIMGVSYGMTRLNAPQVRVYQVNAPDLINPLGGNLLQRPETVYSLSPDLIPPYVHHYSLGIERTVPLGLTLRAGYVGTRTFHLLTQQVYNRARPSSTIPNTTATIQERRPDQRYGDLIVIESSSNAYYDALVASVDKRLSNGLTFRLNYAFGKNLDTGGDYTNTATGVEKPPETGTSTCELCDYNSDKKGLSLFDTTHALALSYSYTLPFFSGASGLTKTLFSGWQISGLTSLQSGTPYHMHTGSDGPGLGNVDGWGQDRPNIKNPKLLGKSFDDPDTSQALIGASCTRVAGGYSGTYIDCPNFDTNIPLGGRGNIGMNVFRKDGTHNWNMAFGKTFALPGGRERSLAFRGEFINFFNHAQFDKPNVQISGNIFGQITNTANKGRQVQFSLRLNF